MLNRSIALTGDGSRVVVRTAQRLHIVCVNHAGESSSIDVPALVDFAIVGSELWVVDLIERANLRRFTLRGELIGSPQPLGDAGRRLLVPGSNKCAVWLGAPFRVIDAVSGSLRALPGEAEFALPISSTRWITCQRGQVALRDPAVERWHSDAIVGRGRQVVNGTVLFDATSAAVVTTSVAAASNAESVSQLVVFGLREPIVQHRFTLAGADAVRFACGRGHAIALIERRRLVLLDLRFGAVLAQHTLDKDVSDLAIDDGGQNVALRHGEGIDDVVVLCVRDLLAIGAPVSYPARVTHENGAPSEPASRETVFDSHERAPSTAGSNPAIPVTAHDSEPSLETSKRPAIALGSVAALAPRPPVTPITEEEVVALLEGYRELAAALAERAIALAWDERRLTAADADGPPFRAEVHGIRRRSQGNATSDLEIATNGVIAAVQALASIEARLSGRTSPIGRLVTELDLSPTAFRILLVAAAPVLWGELARLYAILTNDVSRPLCDEQLVTTVLGPHISARSIARELDPDAPLVRHGILRIGPGVRPFAALSVEPVVLQLFRGIEHIAIPDVRVVEVNASFETLWIPPEVKARIATLMATPPIDLPRIVVRGRPASGRHTLLATLAAASGRRLGVIDAGPVLRDLSSRGPELEQSMRRAHLLGLLPCIDGLESIPLDDPSARERVRDILRNHPGPLAIRLPREAQPPLDPGYIAIDLPALSMNERLDAWTVALAAHGLEAREPLDLATRYSVGPGAIVRACRAVAHARAHTTAEVTGDASMQLEATLRQHIDARLGNVATRVERLATWSQVILPTDIQDSLTELIARIKHRRTVFETWRFDRVVTTSRGVVALFAGGPGTGKTLVAGAIANDLGVDLYRVDLSRIVSKWIGETEQNLAKLFDAAEDAHAIILFDEADSLFAKRTKVQSSVDRYANLEVNYLLQRLDSFDGIAILTTNFGSAIDRAFSRRLTVRITFPFPDEETREKLWRAHLPKEMPTAGRLDLAELARRFKLSGGYIRNAALRAAFLAAEEHTPLTQDHLERAIRAEFREIGQLSESSVLE